MSGLREVSNPPESAEWLLSHVFPDHGDLTTLGDLREEFNIIRENQGLSAARCWYWWQLFKSLPRSTMNLMYWSIMMFWNTMKLSLRQVMNDRFYFLLNLFGLSIAITSCFVMIRYSFHEMNYDKFHHKSDRLYRIVQTLTTEGVPYESASAPKSLRNALKNEFPEIQVARISKSRYTNRVISRGTKSFSEPNFFSADSSFFELFDFDFITGSHATWLSQTNAVVLTEVTAQRYFGDENPTNRTLNDVTANRELIVAGVVSVPENTHLSFDMLARTSFSGDYWGLRSTWTYLYFPTDFDVSRFERQLPDITRKYFPENLRNRVQLDLQSVTDIHLHSHLNDELGRNASPLYVKSLPLIAFIVVLFASINFITISIAQSTKRIKEIGVRKVLGASRLQLMLQFLGDAVILATVSALVSFALIQILLPSLSSWIGIETPLRFSTDWQTIALLLALAATLGLLSGSYPALVISAFLPATTLKGTSFKKISLLHGLIVFQSVCAITLLIGTIVVHNQLNHIRNRSIGIQYEQVIVLHMPWQLRDYGNTDVQVFKNALLDESAVQAVTVTTQIPWGELEFEPFRSPTEPNSAYHRMRIMFVDENFAEVFGIRLLEGRQLARNISATPAASYRFEFMINEKAKELLNLGDDAIGKKLEFLYDDENNLSGTIVGVVEDFFFKPVYAEITPLVLVSNVFSVSDFGYVCIKVNSQDMPATLSTIRTKWEVFAGDWPFDYVFLDKEYDKLYKSEQILERLTRLFSFLLILLSSFGLLAVSSFATEQRTREIGIRKTFGASVGNILLLLSKEFMFLVLMAFTIAVPVAFYTCQKWLEGFASRTEIGIESFVITAVVVFVVSLGAVNLRGLAAARVDPAVSTKYEA